MATSPTSERGPSAALLACLCALASLPAATLGVLLAIPQLSPFTTATAVAVGLVGNGLLVTVCVRQGRRLRRAWAASGETAERLRVVSEVVGHAVFLVDANSRVISSNTSACRNFGYPLRDLIGLPLSHLLGDEIASRLGDAKTCEQRMLGGGRPIEAIRKDGSRFPASLVISKSRQADPAPFVVLIQDLTELNEARHAADAAARTKASFLRRLNHELRTPLAGILGTVELLRDTPPGDEQERLLDAAQGLGEGLLQGFEQLVDYARLEADEVELCREPFSLRETVEQAIAPLAPAARAKGIGLNVRIAPDVPDRYEGDSGRVRQVLANLVGNAVKFTSTGEVTLDVRFTGCRLQIPRKKPGEGSGDVRPTPVCDLQFLVEDTGMGIAADRLQAIFGPFEQADGSATRRHGGMGLGLSVAARLVALMGGRINAESEPDRGSRFHVELPLRPAAATPGSRCVLVVLSDDDDRRALERHLGEWGIRAIGARNGRQALTELLRAVVEGSPYGLVLIEEHLPDLSAREVLHRLRYRSETAPPALLLGLSETDVPLPDGVCAVLPRRASALQTYKAVLRAFSPHHG